MGKLILVLGGARSGKSRYAETRAREIGDEEVLYVATAEIKDDEMAERVQKHRERRPTRWRTLENTTNLGSQIKIHAGATRVVLVDCLSLLVARPFMAPGIADPFDPALEESVRQEILDLIRCADDLEATTIVVSNEVGMGVVPPHQLGRAYRDVLGRANQLVAAHADEVHLLVAGIPLTIKENSA